MNGSSNSKHSEARFADPLMGWNRLGRYPIPGPADLPEQGCGQGLCGKMRHHRARSCDPAQAAQAAGPTRIIFAELIFSSNRRHMRDRESGGRFCVRSPGQVRKEAAQVNCGGSLGSFFHDIRPEAHHEQTGRRAPSLVP